MQADKSSRRCVDTCSLCSAMAAGPATGLVATSEGHVSGPPDSLSVVRFADGWALYDLVDPPDPERVRAALCPLLPRRPGTTKARPDKVHGGRRAPSDKPLALTPGSKPACG